MWTQKGGSGGSEVGRGAEDKLRAALADMHYHMQSRELVGPAAQHRELSSVLRDDLAGSEGVPRGRGYTYT